MFVWCILVLALCFCCTLDHHNTTLTTPPWHYWRTVSADRGRIAGIRKADARAEGRKEQEETAKELAAQKE
jgi:hypothetical protein